MPDKEDLKREIMQLKNTIADMRKERENTEGNLRNEIRRLRDALKAKGFGIPAYA